MHFSGFIFFFLLGTPLSFGCQNIYPERAWQQGRQESSDGSRRHNLLTALNAAVLGGSVQHQQCCATCTKSPFQELKLFANKSSCLVSSLKARYVSFWVWLLLLSSGKIRVWPCTFWGTLKGVGEQTANVPNTVEIRWSLLSCSTSARGLDDPVQDGVQR